ncbi:PQ loop repeat-domain-containing protein [Auriculariales sp. MPI-PUGE-AT-0066]|nr:PQ loop repeat-domain-containing protein [Auriculariales sp. MPI-PUGE-AT-0066]
MFSSAIVSAFFGYLSMGCWIVATLPQVVENWSRKSADGLAPAFIAIWALGDVLNLAASVWQHVLRSMILLAAYYVAQDFVLVYQMVLYHPSRARTSPKSDPEPRNSQPDPERQALLTQSNNSLLATSTTTVEKDSGTSVPLWALGLFVLSFGVAGTLLDDSKDGEPDLTWVVSAQVMGWGSALLYLSARIPQIFKNRETRCEGLAPGMFILSVFANSTYVVSILAKSMEPEYVLLNLSWLAGGGGVIFFDFIVLAQFLAYKSRR